MICSSPSFQNKLQAVSVPYRSLERDHRYEARHHTRATRQRIRDVPVSQLNSRDSRTAELLGRVISRNREVRHRSRRRNIKLSIPTPQIVSFHKTIKPS